MVKIALVFILLAFVGNVVFLDYLFVSQRESLTDLQTRVGQLAAGSERQNATLEPVEVKASESAKVQQQAVAPSTCPQSCLTMITDVKKSIPEAAKSPPPPAAQINSTQKGEFVIPLGSGSVNEIGTWTDIYTAQATVDTSSYSKIKAIYFEAVMHAPNGGEVKAKLYDASTPFSYDGQILSTKSQAGELVSVLVPLVSGSKTYRVRLSASIAPGILDSARIRVVTQ